MTYKKKLIEVALPLEAINAESSREKSIRHGHPSTLHLWWARRPLAAARAVIWASLVDDPSSLPEQFPTEEAQNAERERLFTILTKLVKWEKSNNPDVLKEAKAEIMRSTDGNPPALLDPFAGGGAIPLEAQRLGLEAHASDLNPVAVMINKAMIEIPPKFADQAPINPKAQKNRSQEKSVWRGAQGLAEDVRYYGQWMKQKAFEKIGHLYPKVKDENGEEHTVIAWIWARTVKCPNPACGCEMPLVHSFELSKKKGKEAYVQPVVKGKEIHYEVKSGKGAPEGSVIRTGASCIACKTAVDLEYIRSEGRAKRLGAQMIAVVAEGNKSRLYLPPDNKQIETAECPTPKDVPISDLPEKALSFRVQAYGMTQHKDLFTNRQLTALTTFCDLVAEAQKQIQHDGGSKEYAQAVAVYLAFVVDKLADLGNSLNRWEPNAECPRQLFGRQAIPMVWDFAEGNAFSNSSGSWSILLSNLSRSFKSDLFDFGRDQSGIALQHDAQTDNGLREIMVSTDPPYYDNIGYADLSDFFYVWMRQSLKKTYSDIFHTMLVPKTEELVATPYRFDGSKEKARVFFESGMLQAFKQINSCSREDVPVTVYYAFKQSDEDDNEKTASTGWETMLSAIIQSGFAITGTWPIRSEMGSRMIGQNTNALASSIVLVCRKRAKDAPSCSRMEFTKALKRELKPALAKLQAANIAPVDLAQSAIGPGMSVYSRYSKILEADGKEMGVRSALQIINQELDHYFTEQSGELDSDSRFCVDLYSQYAFNDLKFGEAEVLAKAKNTSVDKLTKHGVLYAQKGVVRLLGRDEIPGKVETKETNIWLLTQQLTRAMATGGVVATATILADFFDSNQEHAKTLAYRLFTIAERKGWSAEAYAYNALVISWSDVQTKTAELKAKKHSGKQRDLF